MILTREMVEERFSQTGVPAVLDIEKHFPGVSFIAKEAFQNNTVLETVIIPKTVDIIDEGAFKNCSNLKCVMIHEGLKVIEKEAFQNTQIEILQLPKSMEIIEERAFLGCRNLIKLETKADSRIAQICNSSFEGCTNLQEATLFNAKALLIEPNAFKDCHNLTKIEFQSKAINHFDFRNTIPNCAIVYKDDLEEAYVKEHLLTKPSKYLEPYRLVDSPKRISLESLHREYSHDGRFSKIIIPNIGWRNPSSQLHCAHHHPKVL